MDSICMEIFIQILENENAQNTLKRCKWHFMDQHIFLMRICNKKKFMKKVMYGVFEIKFYFF